MPSLLLLLLLLTVLTAPEAAFALGGPRQAGIHIEPDHKYQDIQAGDSATFKISVYPLDDWGTGKVTLRVVNPPQGVTATFTPKELNNITLDASNSSMTVKVAADVPSGEVTLTVQGTGTALQYSRLPPPINVSDETNIVLNIIAPKARIITTTITLTAQVTQTQSQTVTSTATQTSTSTSTTTLSTTLTSTTTATEQVTDHSTYAWAIGATAIAALLAIILLRKRG